MNLVFVRLGRLCVAKLLIKHGANIDARNKFYNTPLILAARYGNLLIDFCGGMKNNCVLVHLGHLEVVKILIENGANVGAKDKDNNTALMQAIQNGYTDEVIQIVMK